MSEQRLTFCGKPMTTRERMIAQRAWFEGITAAAMQVMDPGHPLATVDELFTADEPKRLLEQDGGT